MLRKNEEREGVVASVGAEGEGILKDEGIIVFVPFALPGEKIKYKVLKVKDKFAFGKVLEILTPAEERVRPKCPAFGKCGGCRLQHVKYSNQLKIKEKNIETCFAKIAGLRVSVSSCAKGDNEYRYRNNLQLPVRKQNGQTVLGFYAENSHRVVPIEDCLINAPWTSGIINAAKAFMEEFGLEGYCEETGEGDVKEITVKDIKGNLIITLVSPRSNVKGLSRFPEIIKKFVKYTFSLYLNVNPHNNNVIYGEEFRLICGAPEYSAEMLGIKFKIGVTSFMQVNNSVCSKLYSAAISLLKLDGSQTVIDAYSGAGVMTALLALRAKKAIGIEVVPEAVHLADILKEQNGLGDKMENIPGRCEDELPGIITRERAKGGEVNIVLDPPRKGCDIKVIEALIESGADKIVYISCKPSTLARDVGLLVGSLIYSDGQLVKLKEYTPRYTVKTVKPFDMFAQTKHIETLVLLERTQQ